VFILLSLIYDPFLKKSSFCIN